MKIYLNGIATWEVPKYTYSDSHMGIRSISLTLEHPSNCLDESIDVPDFKGATVEYNGESFYISSSKPTGEKSTGSLNYKYTLVFKGAEEELTRRKVRNLALAGVESFISQGTSFSIYANLSQFQQLLQNNLTYYFGDEWTVNLLTTSSDEARIDVNNTNIWELILKTYEYFGLRWIVVGKTINIGYKPDVIEHVFDYGKEGGLVKITRTAQSDAIINRLIGTGSGRNIPVNYFTDRYDKFPKDPNPISDTANIRTLMPKVFRDSVIAGNLPYIDYVEDPELVEANGVIEGVEEVNDEIYPSIAGVEVDGIGRIDQIIASSIPVANSTDEDGYSQVFDIWVKDIGFDLIDDKYTSTSDAKISFTSGALAGYEFTILTIGGVRQVSEDTSKSHNGVSSKYRITLIKSDEDFNATGRMLPNKVLYAESGDSFVIYDIEMPQSYVELAEERFEAWLIGRLDKRKVDNPTYAIDVMDSFFHTHINESDGKTIQEKVKVGNKIKINNIAVTDGVLELHISQLTVEYGGILPKYTFTVTDNVGENRGAIEKIQSDINRVGSKQVADKQEIKSNLHTHANKMVLDLFKQDSDGNVYLEQSFYSMGGISALGLGKGGGSGGGGVDMLDSWANYTEAKASFYVPANLLVPFRNDTLNRLTSLESGSATSITTTGTGNAITSVSKDRNTLTFEKGSTFSLSTHKHDTIYKPIGYVPSWSEITNKPTTFTPSAHTHTVAQITNFPSTWAWSKLTGVPTTFAPSAHTHTVAQITNFPSTWAWSKLTGVPTTFAPSAHTHTIANVTGLQTALDSKEPSFTKNTAFNKNFGTVAETVMEGNDSRIHSHSNKAQLDLITQAHINVLNKLFLDGSGNLFTNENFYSTKGVSALGLGDGGGGGGDFDRLDAWVDYNETKANWVLSALLGYDLHTRVNSLEASGGSSNIDIAITGSGNALTDVSKDGNLLTFSKSSTFALSTHNHTIANITGLQDALDGKEPSFAKNTAFNKDFGTTAGTVVQGNDSRIHSHSNKALLDQITQSNIDVLNLLSVVDGNIKVDTTLWATGGISALGLGEGGGSGGGGVDMLDSWANYTTAKANYYVPSSLLVPFRNDTLNRLTGLQGALDGKQPTISTGTTSQYFRGDKTWQTLNTSVVSEGANLYFTNARVKAYGDTLYSLLGHTHTIAQITGLQGALNLKATQSDIDTAIDGIEIGGRNLIPKSNFVGLGSSNSWNVVNDPLYNGGVALKLDDGRKASRHIATLNNCPVGSYTLSARYYISPEYNTGFRVATAFTQPNTIHNNLFGVKVGEWHTHSLVFENTIEGSTISVSLYNTDTFTQGYIIVDWIKLEKGNKATDWTPAPEDVQAEIDGIEIGGRNLIQCSMSVVGYEPWNADWVYNTLDNSFTTTILSNSGNLAMRQVNINIANVTGVKTLSGYITINGEKPQNNPAPNGYTTHSLGGVIANKYDSETGYFEYTVNYTRDWQPIHIGSGFLFLASSGDVVKFTKLKFEKGNKATDWTPAPEDQVSDWNETDVNSFAFLKNKPTQLSQFTDNIGVGTHIANKANPHAVTTAQIGAVDLTTNQTIGGVKSFTGNVTAPTFIGALSGNASSATNSDYLKTSIYSLVTPPPSGAMSLSRITSSSAGSLPTYFNANGVLTINTHPGDYYHQLGFSSDGKLYHRSFSAEVLDNIKTWGRVAYTTDNVASATKLQTAIKIAGVSFDGSDNIDIPFANLTSKPTTLEGYGITDAVTLNTTQSITGAKTFSKLLTANAGISTTTITASGIITALGGNSTNWNKAYADSHTHTNKAQLDVIDQNLSKGSNVGFNSAYIENDIEVGGILTNGASYFYGDLTMAEGDITTPVINIGGNWSIELSGTELVFKYQNVIKQRMLSDGTILATRGITALST